MSVLLTNLISEEYTKLENLYLGGQLQFSREWKPGFDINFIITEASRDEIFLQNVCETSNQPVVELTS